MDECFNNEFDSKGRRICKVKIVILKLNLVLNFWKEFGFYKICEVNNYYYVYDVYFNVVVVKVILIKYF